MQQTVYVKKLHPEAILPRYGSAYEMCIRDSYRY